MRKFEEFTLKDTTSAATDPVVSINTRGYIGLNLAAAIALGEPKRVVLLYDKQNDAVGIKPAAKDVPHSYPMRRQTSGRSYIVSGSAFCRHYKIDTSRTRRFKPKMEGNILLFELEAGVDAPRVIRTTGRKK